MAASGVSLDKLVSLSKRRGFVFQASEIYGGFESTWDYGPLGVELKRRIADAWWRDMVLAREDVVGLDSAILQAPRVWETSGHVSGFNDPLVDCKTCQGRFREDKLAMSNCPRKPSKRPGELMGKGGRYGHTVRIAPPMLLSDSAMDEALSRLGKAVAEVK